MEKIPFSDGTRTSRAKVTIDGVDYIVTPATYSGTIPLSAYIMNRLQTNIENAINQNADNIGGEEYDDTATYEEGDIVTYEGQLYVCIEAVETAEEFDNTKWQEISVLEAIDNIQPLPVGGTQGQVLTKNSSQDGDASWSNPTGGLSFLPKNAGSHNGIYRGENITSLFYNGTLSEQISAGTFDDIFIGDYIIGQNSGRKYLVADIDYSLNTGDTECTTHHILMIPEKSMGTAKMNSSNITTGAYVGSAMYTTNLTSFKTIINNDFGSSHILQHRELFADRVISDGKYEDNVGYYNSTIDLMNEIMVTGQNILHNVRHGTNIPNGYIILDNCQLSLFKLDRSARIARDDNGDRITWWTRDVSDNGFFARIPYDGSNGHGPASNSHGVRPFFLVY